MLWDDKTKDLKTINSIHDYIPITCHYDNYSLITKNGELIQTIQIYGIESSNNKTAKDLREGLREVIKKHINSDKVSLWIHTIREKTDLEDHEPYPSTFSKDLHNNWNKENNWDRQYINTLYVTLLYHAADVSIGSLRAFLSSLSFSTVNNFHDNYLEYASKVLEDISIKIIEDLKDFGAERLGIKYNQDGCVSELLFLYFKITHLIQKIPLLPLNDLSYALENYNLQLGDNRIDIQYNQVARSASIIALKEYQEVDINKLNKLLHNQIEFVITEIIHFIPEHVAKKEVKNLDYIFEVSRDAEAKEWIGINSFLKEDELEKFCNHQILLTIIEDTPENLETKLALASSALARIGIAHVLEDINLEHSFWAQLPGNFIFLKRLLAARITEVGAFASLYNSPIGFPSSIWGKAITLFKTIDNMPYFMNFHSLKSNSGATGTEEADNQENSLTETKNYFKDFGGNTVIIGVAGSGKTVLLNFLISESSKLNPKIIYLANDNSSELFIRAAQGDWQAPGLKDYVFLNPFLYENNEINRQIAAYFLEVLCIQDNPLDQVQKSLINSIVKNIFDLPMEERTFNTIEKIILSGLKSKNSASIKKGLEQFLSKGEHSTLLKEHSAKLDLQKYITAFNFQDLEGEKQENSTFGHVIKTASILCFIQFLINQDINTPKILAVEGFFNFFKNQFFEMNFNNLLNILNNNNTILLTTLEIQELNNYLETKIWKSLFDNIDTEIVIASEIGIENIGSALKISADELKKIKNMQSLAKLVVIKQKNHSIIVKFNLDNLRELKILSADLEALAKYQEAVKDQVQDKENWLSAFYEKIGIQDNQI